jgi:hypothetical protein
MSNQLPIVFALLTGLFWGTYGSALGNSRSAEKSPFKPYVLIAVAYLAWGLIGGVGGMLATKTGFQFSLEGSKWGFIAGSLGALGALALTLAMFTGGTAKPQIVMPIVFGTAVTVNAIVEMLRSKSTVNPMLYVGIAGMAVCIILVAYFTPHPTPHKPAAPAGTPATAAATPPSAH